MAGKKRNEADSQKTATGQDQQPNSGAEQVSDAPGGVEQSKAAGGDTIGPFGRIIGMAARAAERDDWKNVAVGLIKEKMAHSERVGQDEAPTAGKQPKPDYLVDLSQMGAICSVSKRTVERFVEKGGLGEPDVVGGSGRAHKWRWSKVREPLDSISKTILPAYFPAHPPQAR